MLKWSGLVAAALVAAYPVFAAAPRPARAVGPLAPASRPAPLGFVPGRALQGAPAAQPIPIPSMPKPAMIPSVQLIFPAPVTGPAAAPALASLAAPTPEPERARALASGFDGAAPRPAGLEAAGAIGTGAGAPAGAARLAGPTSPPPAGRLPDAVRPSRYDLRLSLDPGVAAFRGSVRVDVRVWSPTDRIVMHALGLTIGSVKIDGRPLDASRVVVDAAAETVTFALEETLAKGSVSLEIEYVGAMNELMRGLYKSRGHDGSNSESWSFSHLEPTHARRVLPSFDEPAFKAKFRVTLDVPEGLTAISNMPASSQERAGGRVVVSFDESPRMSSYLLAVYAARLVPKTRMVGKTKVSVWAPADQISQADFALDVAQNALRLLEEYFGTPYQLPKLDLVAAPDFASGAMENWGAILFRDTSLLVDRRLSSEAARRRVADVVTHEIAHQWFGNLVTMKWWNDLWLNEAFATWIAAKIVDLWRPSWNMWEDFDQAKRSPMAIDALPATRPVRSAASTPAEIQAMFDPITYDKGGALLRMLESWVGEEDFRDGIRAYMLKYAHKNAEAGDLWREIERASAKPVGRLADRWLAQPGMPVLSVEVAAQDGPALRLSQRRVSAFAAADESLWPIPVSIRYRLKDETRAREHSVLLERREQQVTLPGKGRLLWAYPNAGELGYYRVAFDERLLSAAAKHRAELSAAERSGLLSHLWAGVRAGELPVDRFLDALAPFKDDRSRLVLEDVAGYLKALRRELAATDEQRDALDAYARKFFGSHARRLGWDPRADEASDDALARPAVLGALALMGPADKIAAKVSPRLEAYLRDAAKIDASIAPVVLGAAARGGAPRLFDAFRQRLSRPRTPEQKDHMLRALAEFSSPALVDRYLEMTLTDEIRAQDAWKSLAWLLANPAAQQRAWAFIRANWAALLAKLGPRGATRVIGAASNLVSPALRAEVEAFFGDPANEVEMARKTLAQALSAIDLGIRFREAQREPLERWSKRPPAKKL